MNALGAVQHDHAVIIRPNPYTMLTVLKYRTTAGQSRRCLHSFKGAPVIPDDTAVSAYPYIAVSRTQDIICIGSRQTIVRIIYLRGITHIGELTRNGISTAYLHSSAGFRLLIGHITHGGGCCKRKTSCSADRQHQADRCHQAYCHDRYQIMIIDRSLHL